MNKLGIKTSLNEAKALHATAKQLDNDPNLTLPEFQSMLFSGDETVNIDAFRKLDAATTEEENANAEAYRLRNAHKVIDLASLPAEHLEKFRQRNMYRLALQRNIKEITHDLKRVDTGRTYQVDARDLMKVVSTRTKITETMK